MSSSWLSYLGISTHILQPPLPEGDPADVVMGSKDWKKSFPMLKSKHAKLVWIDMKQPDRDQQHVAAAGSQEGAAALLQNKAKGYENWWPGMKRWHLGVICEDSTLELGEPEIISR